MDAGDIVQIICLLILIFLSSFFSSAETSLTTANKIRMRTLSEDGNKRAARVLRITADSGKMLSAILIGNNIVNLSASSLATSFAIKHLGNAGAGIATGVLTFLILIFGEVSPKTMATIYADKLAMSYSGIIEALMKILTPVIFVINHLSMFFLRLIRVDPNKVNNTMTQEEIRTIVDVGQESGVIENEERDIIHNVFDFGDSEVKEIMVPRIDMTFVSADASYDDIIDTFREDKFTRLPVYDEQNDRVIGTINVKDLLLEKNDDNFSIHNILRDPYFTYEYKNLSDLFFEMRQNSISIAIVLDEYGSTAGMITTEDLLEKIVGEIRDEYDTDEVDDIIQLGNLEFLVLGSTNLADVNHALGISLSSDSYDTIGGYCLEHLNRVPKRNEFLRTADNILIRVDQVDKNRVERLFIKLPEPSVLTKTS